MFSKKIILDQISKSQNEAILSDISAGSLTGRAGPGGCCGEGGSCLLWGD